MEIANHNHYNGNKTFLLSASHKSSNKQHLFLKVIRSGRGGVELHYTLLNQHTTPALDKVWHHHLDTSSSPHLRGSRQKQHYLHIPSIYDQPTLLHRHSLQRQHRKAIRKVRPCPSLMYSSVAYSWDLLLFFFCKRVDRASQWKRARIFTVQSVRSR